MSSELSSARGESQGLSGFLDISLLWKRKPYVVLSVLVAVGIAAAYVHYKRPLYEVAARLLVQPSRLGMEKDRLLRTDRTFLVTQGEIVASPVVVRDALESMRAKDSPALDFATVSATVGALHVLCVDDANVMKLTYRCEDPAEGVRILHAVTNSYQGYVAGLQQDFYGKALEVLTRREQELRKELDQLEGDYYQLRVGSRLIAQGREAFSAHLEMLAQLGTRLTEAKSRRIDKETQLQVMNQAPGLNVVALASTAAPLRTADGSEASTAELLRVPITNALFRAQDPATFDFATAPSQLTNPTAIQEQLWQAQVRLKEASHVFGPKHPDMKAMESQIAMLRERLKECEATSPVVRARELEILQKAETHLKQLYETEFNQVKSLDASMLKEQYALAEIQRVQGIYDSTTQQIRELKLADETQTDGQVATVVRMIDPPDESAQLAFPRPVPFISLCAALGFAAGCVLITLSERVSRTQ